MNKSEVNAACLPPTVLTQCLMVMCGEDLQPVPGSRVCSGIYRSSSHEHVNKRLELESAGLLPS